MWTRTKVNQQSLNGWWISKRRLGNWALFSISADTGERTWAFTTKHLEALKCLLVPHGWRRGAPGKWVWLEHVSQGWLVWAPSRGQIHGWNHPRVPNMGLWVRFAPLSSKLAEKTQKDKWDELIASSVIPLAATGMLWNYRLFFFFLKNLFLSLIFPLLWINFFIVNYFKDQTRIEKSIMTTYLPTIKLDQILTLCHICIRYHLKK